MSIGGLRGILHVLTMLHVLRIHTIHVVVSKKSFTLKNWTLTIGWFVGEGVLLTWLGYHGYRIGGRRYML